MGRQIADSSVAPDWYAGERFADIQMLRYRVQGFEHLPLRQKLLVYYLSEAALSGRDILWDQNCRYNLLPGLRKGRPEGGRPPDAERV